MENVEAQSLFVSDPVFNKESVGGFTSYTLQGSKIPEPLSRRYRDFDALRKKLIERWPGVFIPNIPHKKTVGNKDKEIVGMRVEMINRFLKKLSKIDYLYNSDEMELFLQNSSNVSKTLDNIKEDTYEELLKSIPVSSQIMMIISIPLQVKLNKMNFLKNWLQTTQDLGISDNLYIQKKKDSKMNKKII